MDFWDLTKLLARRWYLAVPILVVTAIAALMTLHSVKPSYIGDTHVQMVPPVPPKTSNGLDATQHNPWLNLGVAALGNAAAVTIQDGSVLDDLKNRGESDDFTAILDDSSPLLTIEVVGDSPAQVIKTAADLTQRFDTAVLSLQQAYGVSNADLITTRSLDVATNIKQSNSSVNRAVIAVTGAGVIASVAFTIAIDAIIRRRARRRAGLSNNRESLDGLPDMGPNPPSTPPPPPAAAANPADARQPAVPDWRSLSTNGGARRSAAGMPTIEYRAGAPSESVVVFQTHPAEAPTNPVTATDSTVVLPLSQGTRRSDGYDEERRVPR